jgi:hypothetical protein
MVRRIPKRIGFFNMVTWKVGLEGVATIAIVINLKASGMLLIWPSVPPRITSVNPEQWRGTKKLS